MTESILLFILLIHFLADFGLQTHEQSTKKSYSFRFLCYHTGVYSLIWLFASYVILDNWLYALFFALITFITHTITDMWTSRISSKFFKINDYHNGFVVVGFDQILHYIQLYLTFKIFLL